MPDTVVHVVDDEPHMSGFARLAAFIFVVSATGALLVAWLADSFAQSLNGWFWTFFVIAGVAALASRLRFVVAVFGLGAFVLMWYELIWDYVYDCTSGTSAIIWLIVTGLASAIVGYALGHELGTLLDKEKYTRTVLTHP